MAYKEACTIITCYTNFPSKCPFVSRNESSILSTQGFGIRAGCGNCEKGLRGDNLDGSFFPSQTQDLPQAYEPRRSIESVTATSTLNSRGQSYRSAYLSLVLMIPYIALVF